MRKTHIDSIRADRRIMTAWPPSGSKAGAEMVGKKPMQTQAISMSYLNDHMVEGGTPYGIRWRTGLSVFDHCLGR